VETVIEDPAIEAPVRARPATSWIHWVDAADQPDGRLPLTVGVLDEETGGMIEGLVKRERAPPPPQIVLTSPEQPMLHWDEGSDKEAPFEMILLQ
jgi:hypothetical protein